MATLVLSTVGTALGGPVGGAIGALIGQSFDEQLLAPARRGPRVGDLSVQSSSYGTQIPRIYGTMRMAGSVIWATDLVESNQTTGAKGQPDVTYSYSVSLAVALSSRPLLAIKRIWADGKLLRGEEGDFKVATTFRFYDGSEDQAIDPLIGSIEGIADTPAYRGVAMAMFENLELADYGNRIPFLTFEVVADEEAPAVSAILEDASAGSIHCSNEDTLVGYAAYGRSIRAAVEPLADCYDIALFDDGSVVRSPLAQAALVLADDDLGNAADGQMTPRIQREEAAASTIPAIVRISYYDPQRDYQAGEARASSGEQSGNDLQQDLAAVLNARDAKSLAQRMLARRWADREKLTLRLPPSRVALEPGTSVELPSANGSWLIDKCTVDRFVTIAELRPDWRPSGSVAADAGRIAANPDVVEAPLALALFDIPQLAGTSADEPTLLMAASVASAGWRSRLIDISVGGITMTAQTSGSKSVLGHALTALGSAEPELIDVFSSVDVELVDEDQWLTGCDDDALGAGINLAVVGRELIQFAAAEPLSDGRFRLSRLLRGRFGTEWAISLHSAGEVFCLLQSEVLQLVTIPGSAIGSSAVADDHRGSMASVPLSGESVRPWTPIDLAVAGAIDGTVSVSWTRRSRSPSSWLDEVDVPLGEAREQYRVTVLGSGGAAEFMTSDPALTIAATELIGIGSGSAQIEVRQLGDWAASRPAVGAITLP